MKSRIQEVNVEPVRSPGIHFSVRHVMRFLAMTFACLAFLSPAYAVTPPPDGGYPNGNTAEGDEALLSLTTGTGNTAIGFETLYGTTTGSYNTAIGFQALFSNLSTSGQSGEFNTGTGYQALFSNTIGAGNTAVGIQALYSNTTGGGNSAMGIGSLFYNTTGIENTALGDATLYNNTTGSYNAGTGIHALYANTSGEENTADGFAALGLNTTGIRNTANGSTALLQNSTGAGNVASGYSALSRNLMGSYNVAVGYLAGQNLTNGSNNIDIGANVFGRAGEANTIRIGVEGMQTSTIIAGIARTPVTGIEVRVNANGKLGVAASSARFKEAIKPMDRVSEVILDLKPVTFRYKEEIDPAGRPQFGLVAEEVEKVKPELVDRDEQGKPYTVRYEAVNAMLLNEFIKEHRRVQELEATVAQQKTDFEAAMAKQTAEMANLVAGLKEQESEVRSVKDQLTLAKSRTQVVVNEP